MKFTTMTVQDNKRRALKIEKMCKDLYEEAVKRISMTTKPI